MSFVFEEELAQASVQAARIVHGMVLASLEAGEMPPKDVLEWFTKVTVYQLAQAEHSMFEAETPEDEEQARAAVMAITDEIRQLQQLASGQKMFWMTSTIDDLLKVRMLRLPERYKSLLQPDNLP